MRDEPRHVAMAFQPARAWVRYVPLGVIGIISRWNYPLLPSLAPHADVLAAGNCALLKPSELTPAFFGKFANAGQTCIAPDYILVPTDQAAAFAQAVINITRRSYPTIQENEDYSKLITEHHRYRLLAAIEEARTGGATILAHSDVPGANGKMSPMVVLNAPGGSVLMTEEIFGPVLPVIGCQSLDEAVAFVKARDRPLALY
jgi:acyl-CoA reductase-like NAD-dependent aldehyde dehydrogenase